MNGIVININPVIFHLGGFELRWYGLAIITGVITAALIAIREGGRKGIPADRIYTLTIWAVVGGVLGARLFHVIDRWSYYASNPSLILQFQQGGLAIWGAVAGGFIGAAIYSRVGHLSLARVVDVCTPGLLVAQIIGRIGCIINGDAYGGPTSLPWGFIYTNPATLIPDYLRGVPTHPYPVYEMLWNGLVLLIIWRLRHSFKRDGLLFLSYLPFYALGRFFLTFVRQENVVLDGLQQAQIIALVVFAVSLILLVYYVRKPAPAETSSDQTSPR